MKKNIIKASAIIGVITLILCLAACYGTKKSEASPIEKYGYELVFNDEFDGTELDTSKWLPAYLPHASDSAEGSKATYTLENGCLNLILNENTPVYSYKTKMRVSSVQTFEKNLLHPGAGTLNYSDVTPFEGFAAQYGYFEIRAKLPSCGGGGHIAWWLTGTQDDARPDGTHSTQTGEIDILENLFDSINTFSPKVHPWSDEDLNEYQEDITLDGDYSNEFHNYSLEWTPSGLTFSVDGKKIAFSENSPQYRMCMYLGIYTDCDWSGEANGTYPKTFSIDYVRVYKAKGGYPDCVTKPTEYVTLAEDSALQIKAADLIETTEIKSVKPLNVKVNAPLADGQSPDNLTDGDYSTAIVSVDGPEFPDEIEIELEKKQSIKTLRLGTKYGAGQAPTYIEVLTKQNGSFATAKAVNITWKGNSETPEYADIELNTQNTDGIKLIIKNANLEWKHYALSEIELLTEE